jgi:hypothetical protein
MGELLLSIAPPELLSGLGFLLLAIGLLGEVAVLVEPFESHWTHKPLGFAFAAVVLAGYVIGHIGDDAVTARSERRAQIAETALKKITSDRALSDEQFAILVHALRPFEGQEYQITTYWDMREPLAIANRVHSALQSASWNYVPPASATMLLGGIEGVQVWVHPAADNQVRNAATALVEVLKAANMSPVLKEQNPQNPKDNKIGINLGAKP